MFGKNSPYKKYCLAKLALTKISVWKKLPLQKILFGKTRPYESHTFLKLALIKTMLFDTSPCENIAIPCFLGLTSQPGWTPPEGPWTRLGSYRVPQTPLGASEPTDLAWAHFWRRSCPSPSSLSPALTGPIFVEPWSSKVLYT